MAAELYLKIVRSFTLLLKVIKYVLVSGGTVYAKRVTEISWFQEFNNKTMDLSNSKSLVYRVNNIFPFLCIFCAKCKVNEKFPYVNFCGKIKCS